MSVLPSDQSWTDINGSDPWYPTHGSPRVKPNEIYQVWSINRRGEGITLRHKFLKNHKYCIDTLFEF